MDEHGEYGGEDQAAQPTPNYESRQLENSAVVKTGDGILFGITVTNTNVAAQFVLGFDSRTVPGSGAVPLFGYKVPAGDALPLQWIPGRSFFAGFVLCNSSTQATLTPGSADCLFDVQYL